MSNQGVIHNFSHQALGATFWIRIADEDKDFAERAAESAFYRLDRLDGEFNTTHPRSTLSLINQLPEGEMISVSDDFCTLWKFAEAFKKETAGIFDVTAGSLYKYWAERGTDQFNPDDRVWDELFQNHKNGKFILEGNEFTRKSSVSSLDFSAIILAYACDCMAEALENNWGIHRALIGVKGDIAIALDPPGEASGWRLGLGHTLELKLCRNALASKVNDRINNCLINPITGQPIKLNQQATRAVARTALEAKALATVGPLLARADLDSLLSSVPSRGLWLPNEECRGMFKNLDLTSRDKTTD